MGVAMIKIEILGHSGTGAVPGLFRNMGQKSGTVPEIPGHLASMPATWGASNVTKRAKH